MSDNDDRDTPRNRRNGRNSRSDRDDPACPPWWRFPLVWMVIGGPGLVVVASFFTLWLAITRPDPVVDEDYDRKGVEIGRSAVDKKLMPAMTGRNHAATPGTDVPLPGR